MIFSQGLLGVTWLRYIVGTRILIPMLTTVSYMSVRIFFYRNLAIFTYMYVTLCIGGSLLHRFYYSGEGTLMLGCVSSFIFPWFSVMGMGMSG